MIDRKLIQELINEEITKNEVNTIVNNKVTSTLNSSDFEKKVKSITAKVMSELFKVLWQKRSFWENSVN
jgi:hypothetical protein